MISVRIWRRKYLSKQSLRFIVRVSDSPSDTTWNRRANVPVLPYEKSSAQTIHASSKIILIRHGHSEFNKLFQKLEGPGYIVTPKYFDIYSNLSIIDSPLSPVGKKQWSNASKLSNLIDTGKLPHPCWKPDFSYRSGADIAIKKGDRNSLPDLQRPPKLQ